MTQTPANHPAPTTSGGWCAPIEVGEPTPPSPFLPDPDLPRLRKVLDHVDAYSEQHDQRWWVARRRQPADASSYVDLGASSHVGCGTTRCIAGWVEFLEDGVTTGERTEARATELLGLTPQEANALFYSTALYANHDDQRAAIQAACEAIAERAGERL